MNIGEIISIKITEGMINIKTTGGMIRTMGNGMEATRDRIVI